MGLLDWIRQKLGSTPAVDESASFEDSFFEPEPEPEPEPAAEAPKPKRKKKQKKPSRKERLRAAGAEPAAQKPKPKRKKNKKRRKHLHDGQGDQAPKPAPERRAAPVAAPAPAPEPAPAPVAAPVPAPEPAPEPALAVVAEAKPKRPTGEDTRAWIVVPKLEALLAEVDATLEDATASRSALVTARKRLEREWRALEPVPASHAERLGAAYSEKRGALSGRIAAIPDPRQEEEARCLEAREALIAQAEALASVADVRAAIDQARTLQVQWKKAGRVPRASMDDVHTRWKAAMDVVYARRDAERAERLERQRAVASQAELLVSSRDPVRAAEAVKGLQARWKAIGGVRGEESDELWKRFRAAADQVFEQRRTAMAEKHANNRAAKEALIKQVLAMGEAGVSDPEDAQRQLQQKWRRIGHVAREDADGLWAAFRAALGTLEEQPVIDAGAQAGSAESLRHNPFAVLKGGDSAE